MGKAGSGKSTLMKFIWQDRRTREILLTWAGMKKLALANFFFWNAGAKLQKSQVGLLRSLLFEVLSQCPELIWKIWPQLTKDEPEHCVPRSWSRESLLYLLNQLIKLEDIPMKFCFFIDGLDEYDAEHGGDHSKLIKVLQQLAVSPDMKLCVSSRPWYMFRDAFGGDPKRQIKLEDLTRDDIRNYVHHKLRESPQYRKIQVEKEQYAEFEQEVVTRAQGVFLWVALASQSLLRGFTNADRICDLQGRLRLLPPTLEEYFQHMLDSVEEVYRRMTVQTFQICLQAEEPLPLMTYSFLDELADFDLHTKIRPLKPQEIEDRLDDMRRRLDARTKGLLEVAESTRSIRGPFFSFQVDFLHRTARDFAKTRDVQQMLNPYLPAHFNINLSLIKAFLSQLKALPRSDDRTAAGPFYGLLSLLMTCDHALKLDSDISEDEILHILAETEKVVFSRSHQFMKGKRTAFPGQLVRLWQLSCKPS
jgi:hypothetical protein